MPIHFDQSRWPLVVATHEGTATDDETEKLFKQWDQVLARGQKYASITDLSEAHVGSGAQNKRSLEWLRENEPLLAQWCVGSATVVKSPAIRSLLKTMYFIKPPRYPMRVVCHERRGGGVHQRADARRRARHPRVLTHPAATMASPTCSPRA